MSEAPERIFTYAGSFRMWREHRPDYAKNCVEYVRADLMEAAEQQGYASAMEAERKLHEDRIEELEAKLEKAVEFVECAIDYAKTCGARFPINLARTILAELKGQDDE